MAVPDPRPDHSSHSSHLNSHLRSPVALQQHRDARLEVTQVKMLLELVVERLQEASKAALPLNEHAHVAATDAVQVQQDREA